MRTIYVLWLRQLKRYSRSRARIIGSLGQPILFLVALGFGLGPMYQKAGGGNYIQFLAPGVIGMSILFMAMFSGIEIIWDRQFGFLKETLVAPVPRSHIMIGRTLGGATVAVMQGIVIFILTMVVGFRPVLTPALPLALVFMFLVALLFTGLGTSIASRLEDMQAFPLIMNFIIMPIFFLSGAIFPLQGVPRGLMIAASLDPLTYGVDGIRAAMTGVAHFSFVADLSILTVATVVILAFGSLMFSRIQL